MLFKLAFAVSNKGFLGFITKKIMRVVIPAKIKRRLNTTHRIP